MRVKVFMNTAGHAHEFELLRRFGHGIETEFAKIKKPKEFLSFDRIVSRGKSNTVEYVYGIDYEPCDVAIMFGSWKDRKNPHHVIRNAIAEKARTFICIETPLLTREVFRPNKYYRVGVNGFLNNSAYWNSVDSPSVRFEEVMGLSWKGWAENVNQRDEILIGMQLSGDASLRNNNINEWIVDTITRIRRFTDKPIRIRTHPGISDRGWENYSDLFRNIAFGEYGDIRWSNGREKPWEDDIVNACCVVTYSSGLSIDAILAGVPVIATDPGNFAYNISSNFADDINDPKQEDSEIVMQWLYNLAYCQWSEDEMFSGTCWRHLQDAIKKSQKAQKELSKFEYEIAENDSETLDSDEIDNEQDS